MKSNGCMNGCLNTSDVAERLNISTWYARQLMRSDYFPSFKIGKLWKVTEEDLNKWVNERRQTKW